MANHTGNDIDPAQQSLLTGEDDDPSSSDTRNRHTSIEERPLSTKVFVISCLIALVVVLLFFLIAPWIGSPPRPGTQPSPSRFKPVGPPGSITDKTENWAQQGGSWNNIDLEEAYKAAEKTAPLSNGTHKYKKTVILVSLDGFRADYLDRNLTSALISIGEKGLRAKSMKPQFPSLTFPNHWSMMTGLFPESHGIVANDFWDPDLKKAFNYGNPHKSWDSYWWLGEPIWATAVKQGIRTAVSMWPGPPYTSEKIRPTFWRAYEDRYKWWRKIQLVEGWLDLPVKDRPQLIALYLPEVDQMGHHYGPDDLRLNKTLENMDQFADALHQTLTQRNLTDIVEVIYVSDHGMSATSDSRIVYLDEILGDEYFKQIRAQDGWPSAGLWFPDEVDTKPILEKLVQAAKDKPGFDVYTHETMPARWHYSHSHRIAPIYVIPQHGWVVSTTEEHRVVMNGSYTPKGVHGYDNDHPEMQAIFIAHGPFAEKIKAQQSVGLSRRAAPNSNFQPPPAVQIGIIPSFSNVEVFSLIAKLLDIKDLPPNNCTKGFWDQYF